MDLAALELSRLPSENARPQAEVAESPAPRDEVAAVADESQAPAASASKPEEPASAGDAVQPVSGLISAEFQPPLEAIGGLGVETSEDLVLDVSGNTEFRVPDASEDFKALADRMNAPPEPRPARRPEPAPRVAEDASTASRRAEAGCRATTDGGAACRHAGYAPVLPCPGDQGPLGGFVLSLAPGGASAG